MRASFIAAVMIYKQDSMLPILLHEA